MYKLKRIIYPEMPQSHVHYYVVVPDEKMSLEEFMKNINNKNSTWRN